MRTRRFLTSRRVREGSEQVAVRPVNGAFGAVEVSGYVVVMEGGMDGAASIVDNNRSWTVGASDIAEITIFPTEEAAMRAAKQAVREMIDETSEFEDLTPEDFPYTIYSLGELAMKAGL